MTGRRQPVPGVTLADSEGEHTSTGSGGIRHRLIGGLDAEGIKSVGGLIVVVTGIIAVTALALVTTQAGSLSKEAVVAITSSAFGIISTVIGAYLGIKISSEASTKTNETLRSVALEKHPRGDNDPT